MKQSTVPEIANLAKKLDIENYWNVTSDNISVESNLDNMEQLNFLKSLIKSKEKPVEQTEHDIQEFDNSMKNNYDSNNNVTIGSKRNSKPSKLNLMVKHLEPTSHSLISPTLTCTTDEILSASPNIYFVQKNYDKVNENTTNTENIQQLNENKIQCSKSNECAGEIHLQR